MANKKIIIPKYQLPSTNSNNDYLVKYRLVADRTKASDWSTIEVVSNATVNLSSIVPSYNSTTKVISLVWQPSNTNTYDVFVKYGTGQFAYVGSTPATNYSVIVPDGVTANATALIQAGTTSHTVSPSLKVALTNAINLV